MRAGQASLLDVQWVTPHLASMGAVALSRARYHEALKAAVQLPQMQLGPA